MGLVSRRNDGREATDLAGKYRLIAELGQGGMATVYLAVALGNSGFRKLAVVKLLRPEIAVDDEFVQMFLDEAKLCARLAHPNIVHTYDVGVDEVGHLMAMEYLDGVSLHAAVSKLAKSGGPLGFPYQAKVLLEVLEGLKYAHELRDYDGRSLEIVHRDVTPHNIFVTYDGQAKLLDFGIAKAATSSVRTATGVIKGKLTYMAPEQARGDHVDARTDLYAVGVMLWEAVTGRRRWPTGLSQPALFTRLVTGEAPESPNAASMGYPAEVDAIIIKAMAPKPDDRFQTAAEFRDALEKTMRGMTPVVLRDLGALLANAFADGRARMRDIIEEQFRTMDAGGAPSEPHQLPALPSPSMLTWSEAHQLPTPVPPTSVVESQSIRVTMSGPKPSKRAPLGSRSRMALVAAGLLTATAIALFAVTATRARTAGPAEGVSAHGGAREVASERTSVRPPAPQADPAPGLQARGESEAQGGDPVQGADSASRPEARIHPSRVLFPATRPSAVRTGAPEATSNPAPAHTAPSAEAPGESTPIRRPDGKPKVQLERDNPWP